MMIKSLVTRIKEEVPYTVGFVLVNLTLSPTSHQISPLKQIADYHLKASDKHFCWMAVKTPETAPFCETASRKNTLKASQAQ